MAGPINLDLGGGKPAGGPAPAAAGMPDADGTKQFADALAASDAQEKLAQEAADRRKQYLREQKQQYGDLAPAVEKATAANRGFLKSLQDGTYAKGIKQLADLNREAEKLRRGFDLRSRFGDRVGGFLDRNDNVLRPLGRGAGYATSAAMLTGGGLVRSGFSGTVEQEKFDREWKLLSREFAGAFKPVIDTATRLTRSLRGLMEGFGREEQAILRYGGLAATGAGVYRYGGAAVQTAGGFVGMTGRAATTSAAQQAAIQTGSTAAGNVIGGAAGGATAARLGLGARAFGAARTLSGIGLAVEMIGAGVSGDYGRGRAAGKSVVGSYAMSLGAGLYDTYHGLFGEGPNPLDKARKDWDLKHPRGDDRDQVTKAGGGWGEIGEGYTRLNTAISLTEPGSAEESKEAQARADDKEERRKLIALLETLKDVFERSRAPEVRRPGDR